MAHDNENQSIVGRVLAKRPGRGWWYQSVVMLMYEITLICVCWQNMHTSEKCMDVRLEWGLLRLANYGVNYDRTGGAVNTQFNFAGYREQLHESYLTNSNNEARSCTPNFSQKYIHYVCISHLDTHDALTAVCPWSVRLIPILSISRRNLASALISGCKQWPAVALMHRSHPSSLFLLRVHLRTFAQSISPLVLPAQVVASGQSSLARRRFLWRSKWFRPQWRNYRPEGWNLKAKIRHMLLWLKEQQILIMSARLFWGNGHHIMC